MFNYVGFHFLVGVEPTHLKDMLVKLDHFTTHRGENKNMFETTNQFSAWRYLNVTFYFTSGWLYSTAAHPDYSIFEGNVSANITQKTPPVGTFIP